MADRLNPASPDVAESDYEKKFNRKNTPAESTKKLKEQESSGGDAAWKTTTKKKKTDDTDGKKGRFGFVGRRGGKLRRGSAFVFIVCMILGGVWYTSILAPNILLVNIKEMYTNDLADATVALDAYYKKAMAFKIGMSQCDEPNSIKCKLTTMSRAQKKAFEKQGFTVIGNKVTEDNRDDDQSQNDLPESRYKVTAILPPLYTSIITDAAMQGLSVPTNVFTSGRLDQLGPKVGDAVNSYVKEQVEKVAHNPLDLTPIVTGDMLYLFAQTSDANKAHVYSVFNPKSSFFTDVRFKQRIKSKYNLTKTQTVTGTTESQVDKSFDKSVSDSTGGIDPLTARPDANSGVSLGSLSNPLTLINMQTAALALTTPSSTFTGLECDWYSLGKATSNAAKQAKTATIARFAMQYLKAADAIKSGQAQEVPINTLSSKLAQSTFGGYGGSNATDSSMYKSIVYGDLALPSAYGFLYYLYSFETIAALSPAWSQLMASAAGLASVTGASGSLVMPPGNLTNTDRDYCLSGEKASNKTELKGDNSNDTRCIEAATAIAPPGTQAAVADAIEVGRRTCPPVNLYDDNVAQGLLGTWRGPISNVLMPTIKILQAQLTPIVAAEFGVNVTAWAAAESLLFTSQTKGVAASDALFAGTGEILGDMAMSRGMTPANIATMPLYLAQRQQVEKDYDDVARYNGGKNPFDIYNKYSFMGSIVGNLSPVYTQKAPLFSTIANVFSLAGTGLQKLNPKASAFYYTQPVITPIDPANPLSAAEHATSLAQYITRLNCPDPEYLAIGITADTACNVRYQMGKVELAMQPEAVLDYMLKSHSDLTQKNIDELNQRLAGAADVEPYDTINIHRMIDEAQSGANAPQIDKTTGKANRHTEYEKFLDYCVNRQDPWGRSGIAVHYTGLSPEEKLKKESDKIDGILPASPQDSGDPNQQYADGIPMPSIVEGASADQDWYTGKKCLEESEELQYFRAYTMLCSVDGSLSGAADCTDSDNINRANYSDSFYLNNDILYTSWF